MSLSFSASHLPEVADPPADSATGHTKVHQYATTSTVMATAGGTSKTSSPRTNDPSAPGADHPAPAPHQPLDFVGSAGAVKDLFALPYVLDRPISVAVHNLGGTLLIDAGDLQGAAVSESAGREQAQKRRRRRPRPLPVESSDRSAMVTSSTVAAAEENPNDDPIDQSISNNKVMTQSLVALSSLEDSGSSSSEALTLLHTLMQQEHALKKQQQQQHSADECAARYIPPVPEPREYLSWKFRDLNLLVGSDALIYRATAPVPSSGKNTDLANSTTNNNTTTTTTALAIRVEDAHRLQALLEQHQETVQAGMFVPDHQHTPLQQQGKPSYAQAAASRVKNQKHLLAAGNDSDGVVDHDNKEKALVTESTMINNRNRNSGFAAPNLDQVQLQTCIVPYANEPFVGSSSSNSLSSAAHAVSQRDNSASMSSPVSTVLDTYLDNIMANVPQLALCLEEKGFIQSVKLLQTEAIPSHFLQRETLDTSQPLEFIGTNNSATTNEDIFSPQVMETNASALLRFLKTNCSRDNATYLFRRDHTSGGNVQLYDISSISAQRQEKWIWWLALISYRFAHRLRHLQHNSTLLSAAVRRNFRVRQRSLLQNTIDLLETLADRNDHRAHESLRASVRENLADTFLMATSDSNSNTLSSSSSPLDPPPPSPLAPASSSELPTTARAASSHQTYARCASTDSLSKAQDHLRLGISILNPVLEQHLAWMTKPQSGAAAVDSPAVNVPLQSMSVETCESSDSEEDDKDDNEEKESTSGRSDNDEDDIEPVATQLFGLHSKMIDVSLRLAEIHLQNYYSSSAMQNLRTSAQHIARSVVLARLVQDASEQWLPQLQLQCTWLWEQCGYFARSFAADDLWRDRGHASGDDVISVLRDVETALTEVGMSLDEEDTKQTKVGAGFAYDLLSGRMRLPAPAFVDVAAERSKSERDSRVTLSLACLSGIVDFHPEHSHCKSLVTDAVRKLGVELVKRRLSEQKTLQRDKRKVLVASSIAYHRATKLLDAYCRRQHRTEKSLSATLDPSLVELLQQRLGDACNETGKVLLNELRKWLVSLPSVSQVTDEAVIAGTSILCSSAEFWFLEGLHSFEGCHDLRNLALMRCNLCQIYKMRANAIFAPPTTPTKSDTSVGMNAAGHADSCLRQATQHLQAAHEAMGVRDVDPYTWDMVSTELAATLLVLGVRRRQALLGSSSTNDAIAPRLLQAVTMRLSPGTERSVIDPLTRALGIYQEMRNEHQAAAAHYQLAQFYCKIWTCQRDEVKTREKLSAAFRHYNAAFAHFVQTIKGNEATFCLLCLDIANLYSSVSGRECLEKALIRCLDTASCFGAESVLAIACSSDLAKRREWFETMETLASSVEDRVFKLLKSLVKAEESENERAAMGSGKKTPHMFKDLYRIGLTKKIVAGNKATFSATSLGDERLDGIAGHMTGLFEILTAIASEYQIAKTGP